MKTTRRSFLQKLAVGIPAMLGITAVAVKAKQSAIDKHHKFVQNEDWNKFKAIDMALGKVKVNKDWLIENQLMDLWRVIDPDGEVLEVKLEQSKLPAVFGKNVKPDAGWDAVSLETLKSFRVDVAKRSQAEFPADVQDLLKVVADSTEIKRVETRRIIKQHFEYGLPCPLDKLPKSSTALEVAAQHKFWGV